MTPTSTLDLEHATRVTPDDDGYLACLSKDWEIWGPNGGYLATIALRAAGMVAQIKRPASFYCHFLSSPAFDMVELKVSVLRGGRRAESFAVEMTQQGKPVLQAMVKTAAEAPGYSHQHPSAPGVPLPETLNECAIADGGLMGVGGRVWDATGNLLASGSAQLCCIANESRTGAD